MSDFDDNVQVEPRNQYLTILMRSLAEAYKQIYLYGNRSIGIKLLCGIVNSLDANSKKKLSKIKEELDGYFAHIGSIQDIDQTANRLYDEVYNFLHKEYLQDAFRFKPFNPNPKHISRKKDEKK